MHIRIHTLSLACALALGTNAALADVKVGFMLPYSGTYAALGQAIENGFKMYVDEQGGTLAGQKIQYFQVDDESDPSKATDNANRLIKRDQVDILIGTVHSGVAMAMAKAATGSDTTLIIANAGAGALTGPLCNPAVFRTSFTNWQPAFAMGPVALDKGYKTAVSVTWNYAAGNEAIEGFKESFEEGGGKVVKELKLPFPNVEFQPILTEIAALKPDVVFTFFAGGGAVKFVQDYAAAGLKTPLLGSGFLTDGTLKAQGQSAQGLLTTLHYADGLNTPKDNAFRTAYSQRYPNMAPDVYAVQGYDAGQLLAAGLEAVEGDVQQKGKMRDAMRAATIDSPRGSLTFSKAGNPIQDIYLRQVDGEQNISLGVAVEKLADPARGCKL
ncbi:ABC transporter substrate-binding protein [Alcaligenes endophyticus]|uniref:ABC transporter substrate-binding protein n=1 Tax=Alcaligenes endophyticus TaxID=1929088 RepID=A0ABT8EH11_9BURK|nr:ABC transporter substrate-binding protein [Alcaligenes endophyticus]MCX5589779.1 ABC transporter substrate-binding protein [Alcaligenes endophyticus]MDN4120558.1 ABC transporter substrate-binding protein [Alcaligenes endophyticus]